MSEGGFEKLKNSFIKIEFYKDIYGLSLTSSNYHGGIGEALNINDIKEQKPFGDIDVYVQKDTNIKITYSDDVSSYDTKVEVTKRQIGINSSDTTEEKFDIADTMQFKVDNGVNSDVFFNSVYGIDFKNTILNGDFYNELSFNAATDSEYFVENLEHGVYEKRL